MSPAALLLCADGHDPAAPVVVAARRTPVGTRGRALASVDVTGLAAAVLQALVADLGPAAPVDEVVLGNCTGPGGDPARVAALAAGLGLDVPGLTLDRQCSSGLDAVALAGLLVAQGGGTVLAGGVESASTAPQRSLVGPDGVPVPYERARFAPDELGDPGMGEAADALARSAGVSRSRQDAYAARSHALTLAARDAGVFDDELVPVAGLLHDDRPRAGLDLLRLSRFHPAFGPDGTATAGSSSGISDGAAAVAVVTGARRRELGVPGLAIRATARVGVHPRLPGLGPVPAVRAVLDVAGLRLDDVGLLEVTEAFASQVLACTDALGLDPFGADADRVCPDGGAIALGHPWGASGALLVVRAFSRLVRRPGPRFAVATCAVGGGQGVAVLLERVG
jgi:acetyl-CoA C-acetyltransferase